MIAQILLIIHIAAGSLALLSGGIAAFAAKGSKLHTRLGRVFAIAMLVTALVAIALSIIHPNTFLLAIGFFTLYLTGSGWLWALRIPLNRRAKLGRYFGYYGLGTAAYMLFAAYRPGYINVVLLVFASILLSMAAFDAFRKTTPKTPLALHGARMGGAYIAAFTAFVVVNIDLGLWGWLAPTAVGSPLISLGIWRFNKRKAEKRVGA